MKKAKSKQRAKPRGDVTLFVPSDDGWGFGHLPRHLPINRAGPRLSGYCPQLHPRKLELRRLPSTLHWIPAHAIAINCQISPIADGDAPRTDADRCHGSIKGPAGLSRVPVVSHAQDEM